MKKYSRILVVVVLVSVVGFIVNCLIFRPNHCIKEGKILTGKFLSDTIDYLKEYKISYPFLALADSFYQNRMSDSAIFYYKKTVNTIENRKAKNEEALLSYLYYQMGINYRLNNNPDSAFIYLKKTLVLQKQIFGENSFSIAKSYIEIGNVHRWIRFDYYNADKYYTQAIKKLEKINYIETNEFLWRCYYNLATVNRLKGDYNKALNYGFYALKISKTHNDSMIYQELCYTGIANVYNSMHKYVDAIKFFKEAIETNTESTNSSKNYLAIHYNNLSDVYNNLNSYQTAITYAKKSLTISIKSNSLLELSNSYEFLGYSYKQLRMVKESLMFYKKSLKIRRNIFGKTHSKVSDIYKLIGQQYEESNQIDSALTYYQNAIISSESKFNNFDVLKNPTFSLLSKKFFTVDIIRKKAIALEKKYNLTLNIDYLKAALATSLLGDSLICASKYSFDQDNSKLLLAENNHSLYETGINCSYQLYKLTNTKQYINNALNLFERNKYQLLQNKLIKVENINKAGVPDIIKEKERNLQFELQYIKSRLDRTNNENLIKTLHSKLFSIEKKLEELNDNLAKEFPSYFKIKYATPSINFENILDYAQNNNTSIIQYFYGNSAIYGISSIAENYGFVKININDSINELFKQFKVTLTKRDITSVTKYKNYINSSFHLYNLLLKPLLDSSITIACSPTKLIIIPDGILANLPFEAMLINRPLNNKINYKNLNYVINHYKVSYAYSSSILLQEADNSRVVRNIIAFSYSEKESNNYSNYNNSSELKGTAIEISFLKNLFIGDFFSGDEASESILKQKVEKYDLLHLAVHGEADTISGIHTKLIFKRNNDSLEDGFLYLHELYNLELKAKLTVLSACETGIGEFKKGEGVFSIGRAFTYAGCPSIIMSLWKVNDETTSYLITKFYNNLKQSCSIDNALHEAKISYINMADEYTAHPANWAAFIASGDMSQIQLISKTKYWSIRIITLLIIGTAFYIFFLKKYKMKNH